MNVKKVVENQNVIFSMLKKSHALNRLSHAYLFYGEEGVGKKEMAYALASILYCPNGGCLECEVCQSIFNNNHMNVEYIGVEEAKTMISKEQITSLQDEFAKTSLLDGTRIYIIDGIDTASSAAQNSLLKFIEDPINSTPTIGIFLAKEISNIVPTIISRCSLEHFKALPIEKRIEILVEMQVDELDSALACSLTNNIDEAYEMINSDSFIKTRELFLKFIELKKPKDAVMYFMENSYYFSNNNELKRLLQWILLFLEDANKLAIKSEGLILNSLCDKIIIYNKKNVDCLKDKLEIVLDLFNKLKYNISARNVFHELIIKLI